MKNVTILFFLFFILSCSQDKDETNVDDNSINTDTNSDENNDTDPTDDSVDFISIMPEKVRIGDTITIDGNNLNRITHLKVNDEYLSILDKQDNRIRAILPIVYNEKIKIKSIVDTINADSISADLIGTFPLNVNLDYDVNSIKLINKNVAFAAADKKLFKTIDGGYNWELINSFDRIITAMFFIDENNGWIGLSENIPHLYSTNDGGTTFDPILKTGFGGGKVVVEIIFKSPNSGYVLTGKGEIYHTNDNSLFNLVYDHPNSNNSSGDIDFLHFSVNNDTVLATGNCGSSSNVPTLVTGENNLFESRILDSFLHNVQLVDNKAFLVQGYGPNASLYVLENASQNEILTSEKNIYDFYFIDSNRGIGVSSNEGGYDYHTIFETYDGGQNWSNEFVFNDFEYTLDIDFHENVGLISGKRGKIWKHIHDY